MSNLDNLISKIIDDCEKESKQIIESAKAEALSIVQKSTGDAEKDKQRILEEANAEAGKTAERILLSKKLEIRDQNLNARREVLDKVFDTALEKLNNMQKDDYLKYLRDNLSEVDGKGGEVILPAKYGISAKELDGVYSGAKLYEGKRSVNGGFILIKDGIEYNRTFEAMIQFYRYELESEIYKILF